jgi:sugar/nucleoside kinase (ribokinase family)
MMRIDIDMDDFDVLVIGRSCLDTIAVLNRFPQENQKAPLEFRLTEGGGQGGTAACCITRLGGRVVYIGTLGNDTEGRFCRQRLLDFGVDTQRVEMVTGGRTPVAYVFVSKPSGRRTIIYEPSGLPPVVLSPELQDLICKAPVVLLDPEVTYLGPELGRLKTDGPLIVYDAERWRAGLPDIMALADYFIPCEDFLDSPQLGFGGMSFVEKLTALNARVKGHLIITRGEGGACYLFGDNLRHVPVPVSAAAAAVDTTGAGDNFHAAFALAVSRGWGLHRAVRFSVAVASLSCRDYGGRNGVPSWKEAIALAAQI